MRAIEQQPVPGGERMQSEVPVHLSPNRRKLAPPVEPLPGRRIGVAAINNGDLLPSPQSNLLLSFLSFLPLLFPPPIPPPLSLPRPQRSPACPIEQGAVAVEATARQPRCPLPSWYFYWVVPLRRGSVSLNPFNATPPRLSASHQIQHRHCIRNPSTTTLALSTGRGRCSESLSAHFGRLSRRLRSRSGRKHGVIIPLVGYR